MTDATTATGRVILVGGGPGDPGLLTVAGHDALAAADVVVTDVRMPPTGTDDGLRAAVDLRGEHPGLSVVVLSAYVAGPYLRDLLDGAGASAAAGAGGVGYLLKERVGRVAAVHVLHGDPQAFVFAPAVVHRDDVRMPHPGRDVGLALEPRAELGVARQVGTEQFQGVPSRQPWVRGKVHTPHAALTERPDDRVPREYRARCKRHRARLSDAQAPSRRVAR